MPDCDRPLEPERVADRDDGVAHLEPVRVGQCERGQSPRAGVDLHQGDVRRGVTADERRLESVVVGEAHLDRGGRVDHMEVGHDVTLLVEHEAGAERL